MVPKEPKFDPGDEPIGGSRCDSGHAGAHGPGCRPGFGPGHGPGRVPRCGQSAQGPGPRAFERGGIKFAILAMVKDQPRHGYDIIREMEEKSGGFYSPSPGVIYPTLQALEDSDLVVSSTQEGKKVYSLTDAGLAFLEEHKERAKCHHDRWEAQWGSGPHGEGGKAVSGISDVLSEVKRAVRGSAADPAKLKEIGAVLEEAAGKIRDIIKR
jgi:DNA-binding PadR family transcriptional regulator